MDIYVQAGDKLAVLLGLLFVASIAWAFWDARSRGKSGCLVALLVALLAWPISLIVWLVFRPELPKMPGKVRFARIPCQCGRHVRVESRMAGTKATCKFCGTEVAVPEFSQLREMLADDDE